MATTTIAGKTRMYPHSPFGEQTVTIHLTADEAHCLFVALDDAERFRKKHAASCRDLETNRDVDDPSPIGSWVEAAERSEFVALTARNLRQRIFGK